MDDFSTDLIIWIIIGIIMIPKVLFDRWLIKSAQERNPFQKDETYGPFFIVIVVIAFILISLANQYLKLNSSSTFINEVFSSTNVPKYILIVAITIAILLGKFYNKHKK